MTWSRSAWARPRSAATTWTTSRSCRAGAPATSTTCRPTWQLDAYPFGIPCVAHPTDATMSPATAVALGRLGGLGVLNVEGLWCRYEDPDARCSRSWPRWTTRADGDPAAAGGLRRADQAGADRRAGEVHARRRRHGRGPGVAAAHARARAGRSSTPGVDILVIQGTIVSAEHVSTSDEPLNLKEFIADLDVPVIVGGCTNYKTALHLMRTGAAGVIVGVGADEWSTTDSAGHPGADGHRDRRRRRGPPGLPGRDRRPVRAPDRRRRHLQTSGDIAKAMACGADAVMLGEPLSRCAEAPAAGGAWWHSAASHPKLPRGVVRRRRRAARARWSSCCTARRSSPTAR